MIIVLTSVAFAHLHSRAVETSTHLSLHRRHFLTLRSIKRKRVLAIEERCMISRGVRMRLCGFRHSPTGRASRPFLAQGPYRRAERRPGKQRTPGPRPLSAVSGKLTSTRCSDGDGGRVAGAARLARPSLRCSCVPRGRAPCSKDREQGMTELHDEK